MAELTPELKKVLQEAGMGGDACWKHKQSGKWIVYHWACERLAEHYGITFDNPQVLENKAAESIAMVVSGNRVIHTGRGKDDFELRTEWSIGEASPQNNKNPYPYAMAEKRAKDRVILKLVGLHGLAFSEEEADDFKRDSTIQGGVRPGDESGADKFVGVTKLKDRARKMSEDLGAVDDEDALEGFLRGYAELMNELKKNLPDWHKAALDAVEAKREQFKQVDRIAAG